MDDDIYQKMKHKSVKSSHAVQMSHFPNNCPNIFLRLICNVYSHMYAYASFVFHHPRCLSFLKKTVHIAFDNSLVKVPDLQPAWMIYLSQNEAQVSEVESCSTNESFFK